MDFGPSRRAVALAVALALECVAIEQLPHPWLHQHQAMAAPIVFGAALLFVGRRRLQAAWAAVEPVNVRWLAVHGLLLGTVFLGDAPLLHWMARGVVSEPMALGVWLAEIVLLVVSLVAALWPLRRLASLLSGMGVAWVYAAAVTLAAMLARVGVRCMWDAAQSSVGHAMQVATFFGVKALLGVFYADVVAVPGLLLLGTARFRVIVAGTCSGMEGVALMLVVTTGWLIYARRELRLRRAVLLVPLALAATWSLNLVRIATLIALGDAGHGDFALNGFHSEAGWILFNAVALGFLLAAQHVRWLRRDGA